MDQTLNIKEVKRLPLSPQSPSMLSDTILDASAYWLSLEIRPFQREIN